MRRTALAISAIALLVVACAPALKLGDPLPGLTPGQRARFDAGRKVFETTFTPETGLGPLFNSDSCVECHEDPVAGGSGDEVEVHVAAYDPAAGFCDPLAEHGGPVIQQKATPALSQALGIDSEPVPREATARAGRSSPDLFGFGLLDAVPDSEILGHADPDDRNHDGISGRPNHFVDGRIGRFGRKALVPTLREFIAGAFVVEQGITNPDAPTEETIGGQPVPAGVDPVPEPELGAEALADADAFVRFLAPPAGAPLGETAKKGRSIFGRIGCQACHVPYLKTGESPIRALSHRKVYAYSDLLLHDMGPVLADICLGEASPSEFRTEPLMGLGKATKFLHDGRAASIEAAINLHGGESSGSKTRFETLSTRERDALLEFLQGL